MFTILANHVSMVNSNSTTAEGWTTLNSDLMMALKQWIDRQMALLLTWLKLK